MQGPSIFVSIVFGATMFVCGMSVGTNSANDKLMEIQNQYKVSVEAAKQKEAELLKYNVELSKNYDERILSITTSNDKLVAGLRKQLSELASRVSKSSSTSKVNAGTRESALADRLGETLEFTDRCSKEADRLTIQLQELQNFIKKLQE